MLARLRKLILEADPNMTEEWKWDTPVWFHKGNCCCRSAFKDLQWVRPQIVQKLLVKERASSIREHALMRILIPSTTSNC